MNKRLCSLIVCLLLLCLLLSPKRAQTSPFERYASARALHRIANPGYPFNKSARRFAILGFESGQFEAWAYPLKLFRNFELSFKIGTSSRLIPARDIVRYIEAAPAYTTLTFIFQSFIVRATYVTAIDKPCAVILLHIDTTEPLEVICSFTPVLQPMWPAGIGGQYAYWNEELKAYLISEPTRQNHAFVGSPAASGISYTPAHMLADVPNEFKIEISDPAQARKQWIPICMAGGKGVRDSIKAVYQAVTANPLQIIASATSHYDKLLAETLSIETPDSVINQAFTWAKLSLDNMLVNNQDLGLGLIAGLGASLSSGRPGFGWFFGGDAYINSLALNAFGAHQTTRQALEFTKKWQRQDGKMAHEISQSAGYIDWFGKYPYAYIHGDTSPFYIVAVYDYFLATADTAFLRDSWNSLHKAYAWCLSTDANQDALMDNARAGLGSVEYGALTNLATDIYTGSLSVHMAWCYAEMARILGKTQISSLAHRQSAKACYTFDARFWNPQTGCYSNAFNDKNEQINEVSPWIATAALFAAGDSTHTLRSLQRLSQADLSTDWGMRSISNQSQYYGALNYNYGAVWPFLTGFVSTAQLKYGLFHAGFQNMLANCRHTFDNNLGAITEVYSGTHNTWPQEAVSQQGFSSTGVILPLVRGVLGLSGNASKREIRFAPQLPGNWDHLKIENYEIGSSKWAFSYQRSQNLININVQPQSASGYALTLAPFLAPGSRIDSVLIDNVRQPFVLRKDSHYIQPVITALFHDKAFKIAIHYQHGLELMPRPVPQKSGADNHGLKILSMKQQDSAIEVELEGKSAESYILDLFAPDRILCVENATWDNRRVTVRFPDEAETEFVKKQVVFHIKNQ